jgi:gamma-glutamyltranspeptidase/glutathione hydrolase
MGHKLKLNPIPIGDANNILIDIDTGVAYGFSDKRKGGLALGPEKIDKK